jgi:hypothetical protein
LAIVVDATVTIADEQRMKVVVPRLGGTAQVEPTVAVAARPQRIGFSGFRRTAIGRGALGSNPIPDYYEAHKERINELVSWIKSELVTDLVRFAAVVINPMGVPGHLYRGRWR